ncbi:MAG: DciA family protein [Leptolyngbyaceae cyanobacterium]
MESIQALMQSLERSPQWRASASLRRILFLWPQLVGEAVAQHSRPTNIYRQVLQVSVSSAAWSQTLTFERSRILQNLHTRLPETQPAIRDLRFATADWHRMTQQSVPTATASNRQHPSWAAYSATPNAIVPQTAGTAFQQWAERKQQQLAHQGRCPRCQSPCPTEEIKRWGVCTICIARQWHTLHAQNRH